MIAASPTPDPLERLRAIIEVWPETREKLSHGAPTWWGGRTVFRSPPSGGTFATFADDHHGDGRVAGWVTTLRASCA